MKALLRDLAPPLLLRAVRHVRNRRYGFFGDYPSFAAAQADALGYEAPEVVQAMASRTTHTPAGAHIDSRAQQVLAAMALMPQRPLWVLDFGGANGGYFELLRPFVDLRWTVLETPALAKANQHRATDRLSFIGSPDDAGLAYDLVLMSGVLQYLEEPHAVFDSLSQRAPYIIVNRLPLIDGPSDRLTVQRVHPSMYRGSYPAWFFSRERFAALVAARHNVVMRWTVEQDTATLDGVTHVYEGMLLKRR